MNVTNNLVLLSLGSNIGDKKMALDKAIQAIGDLPETDVVKLSSRYSTKAWGKTDQADFINQVMAIFTTIPPRKLMQSILEIEESLGRVRSEKWGPRVIDIDLLFYGDQIIEEKELIIPHPEIQNRMFILIPLEEIHPEFFHPTINKSITELRMDCKDELQVYKMTE